MLGATNVLGSSGTVSGGSLSVVSLRGVRGPGGLLCPAPGSGAVAVTVLLGAAASSVQSKALAMACWAASIDCCFATSALLEATTADQSCTSFTAARWRSEYALV